MRRGSRLLALLIVIAVLGPGPGEERTAWAEDGPSASDVLDPSSDNRRTVVCLCQRDPSLEYPAYDARVHQSLAIVLEHLGCVVRQHFVEDGPPPEAWLPDARAIVTWFASRRPLPAWVWPWLEREGAPDVRRVVHLHELGGLPRQGREADPRWVAWLEARGLAWREGYVPAGDGVHTAIHVPGRVPFEYDPRLQATVSGPANRSDANRVWVETWGRAAPDDRRAPVVTGPWGGLALAPWTLREGDDDGTRRWGLEPFAFVREALGLAGRPAVDPCVRLGRRLFLFHIDGDGFEHLSTVRRGTMNARIVLDEVLDRFRLPVTLSVIVGGMAKRLDPPEPTRAMVLARKIFARPYAEPASHGVMHPFAWVEREALGDDALKNFGYRQVEGYRYSTAAEVRDSVRFIERHLLPEGTRCGVMLWTGHAVPTRAALDACAELDLLDMNGGTFRWDAAFRSMAYVRPWGRFVGPHHQVYASASNEHEFEGFSRANPSAFRHIGQTLAHTGRGRILKPANVYAHFYSGSNPPRLAALRDLVQRFGVDAPTLPVVASTWIRAVRALPSVRVQRTASGWRVRGAAEVPTLRFDDERRHVDPERSRGVVGAHRMGDALYVALQGNDAHVVLRDAPTARPHIVESNHLLEEIDRRNAGVTFRSMATMPRVVTLAGWRPGAEVVVRVGPAKREQAADDEGRLVLRLPAGGPETIDVRSP